MQESVIAGSRLFAVRQSERLRCTSAGHVLVLSSLLVFYVSLAMLFPAPAIHADAAGYVDNAACILNAAQNKPDTHKHIYKEADEAGPVSPTQNLRLWWGPGYTLILVPFLALRLPWVLAKALNGIFLFGAARYFYGILRQYVPIRTALVITLCFGLFPPVLRNISQLSPENLALLTICGFMFHVCALYNKAERRRFHLLAASLCLAVLALAKVFFGWLIVTMLVLTLALLAWRRDHKMLTAARIFALALIWCTPYLAYTYYLTGKLFYWGTSGGMSLYWMSTPNPNESGSWFSFRAVQEMPELAQHRPFFGRLEHLSDVKRDEAFKHQAIANIKHHPLKYICNWSANVGRLLFSYPYSFTPQKMGTYFFIVPNMFLVVLFVLTIIPAVLRRTAIPFELWLLLSFAMIAIGGSSLLSAYERQFMPLIPVVCLWLAFVYVRVLRIELRSNYEISQFSRDPASVR